MNEGSESSAALTPEQELLIEGCKSYLDVIHATNAFQARICHTARDVIRAARNRISKITQLEIPLDAPAKEASAYVYPSVADDSFTGSQAWVGAYIWLDRPVYATLYLVLAFPHNPDNAPQPPDICCALEVDTKLRIRQYSNVFRGHPSCKVYDDWDWLAVEIRRPLENPLKIHEEFTTMLDNALTWWDNHS